MSCRKPSASWARAALLQAGAPENVAIEVERLVVATKHAVLPVTPDEQLLVDIDLAIPGHPPIVPGAAAHLQHGSLPVHAGRARPFQSAARAG